MPENVGCRLTIYWSRARTISAAGLGGGGGGEIATVCMLLWWVGAGREGEGWRARAGGWDRRVEGGAWLTLRSWRENILSKY